MSIASDLQTHENAVFLVQPGGRIRYINDQARHIFDVWDISPNLERLARKTRPGETFLNLCANEGRAQVIVGGQTLEATSFVLPNGSGDNVLVSFRPQQVSVLSDDKHAVSDQTLEIFTTLNQTMAADLELEATLQAILDSVERLIPTDFAEITIWEPDTDQLVPYRFVGTKGVDRHLELTNERYPLGEGYSGTVAALKEMLLIEDVDQHHTVRPLIDRRKYPFNAYLGMPLLVGGELIGTLDLTSLDKGTYGEGDAEILRLLSGQAAIALHNALLYREETRRARELASLAQLTQAISAVRDYKELFARLSQGIAPLLEVEIAGFLLFNENTRQLVAQQPFVGVPPQFVTLYQTEIPPESPADKIWRKQETLVLTDASEDERMRDLGLAGLVRGSGMKHSVLVPLKSGGRALGYLQVANKKDGSPFTQDDERLLSILVGQAAPIVENADLVQQSIQRALRAEALRRIASLSGSEADLDESLKYSVLELSRLLKADAAAIFFLDENVGALHVHAPSIYGVPPELHGKLGHIPVAAKFTQYIVTNSHQAFITTDALEDRRILPPYRLMIESLEVRSAIDIPLIFRGRGVGEIVLASRSPEHFTPSDIQLTTTVAGQLGVAIERASMTHQTDANLRQRVEQLTALTRIGRELNSSADTNHILERVYEEALRTTQATCGNILLLEKNAVANIEDSDINLIIGDSDSRALHPLEKVVLKQTGSILVRDYRNPPATLDADTVRPSHKGVQSALIVPIAYQNEILGLVHLHAMQPGHFNQEALQIVQALAAQAAVAIGNAQRHRKQRMKADELHQRLTALKHILAAHRAAQENELLEKPLYKIAAGIREILSCPAVVVGAFQDDHQFHWVTGAGISSDELAQLRVFPDIWGDLEQVIQTEDLLLNSYFITPDGNDNTPGWLQNLMQIGAAAEPGAVILMPLTANLATSPGLIALGSLPTQPYPQRLTLEILAQFAQETSQIISQHHWMATQRQQIQSLEARLTARQADAAQILGQGSLARSEQHVNAVLEIIEYLARQPDRQAVLHAVGTGLRSKLAVETVIIVEMHAETPQLAQSFGDVPQDIQIDALLGQRNPLVQSIHTGETYLVEAISQDDKWQTIPLFEALHGVSFICFPILAQAGAAVAVLAVSSGSPLTFSPEDEKLYGLLARQTANALNNLSLLEDTGQQLKEVYLLLEFSRQLGGLEPTRIAQLLVESTIEVIQPAQAGMLLLFDEVGDTLKPVAVQGYPQAKLLTEIDFYARDTLARQVFLDGQIVRVDEVNFSKHYHLNQDDLLRYRQAVGGTLPVSALLLPVQSGQENFGVLIVDNFEEVNAFSLDDQALVSSLVRQSALTLENIRLYRAAEQRAAQLDALSDVSAQISTYLEYTTLLDTLLDTLKELVSYDTGTLWVRSDEQLVIQAVRGFENNAELLGLQTNIDDSQLFADMLESGGAVYVPDTRADDRFAHMPIERLSWLAVPLLAKGEVLGIIALEKVEPDFYKPDHIQIVSTFANQSAVALENAGLYQQSLARTAELDQRSQRLAMLNRFSQQVSSTLDLDNLLSLTCDELNQALPSSVVSVLLYREGQLSLAHESPPQVTDLPRPLPEAPIIAHLEQSLGTFSSLDIGQEELLLPLKDYFAARNTVSLLILPLIAGNDLHGFIFIHADQGYRFTTDEIELARILANQSAVAIQNAVLYTQTHQFTQELEQRVEDRTRQLENEHRRAQSLLRIMRELSASLDLDHVLNQTLGLLNEISGAGQSTILLIQPGEATFYYRASLGYANPPPVGGRSTALNIDEGLAGWIVDQREGVLIDDLCQDDRWKHIQSSAEVEHRSAMGVPLLVGAELLGVMLLFHREAAHFESGQIELVQTAANQIAVAINNAELFNLVREQAERLGTMLRTQQVETSRSRAILEAVADGVLVTDADGRITLFNDSAQEILDLSREAVLSKSLENFSGLFGRAAQSWLSTISTWSEKPGQVGDSSTYTEQISLDDGGVVAVSLAPVHLDDEFLGTVSIFRDVTHQVEVDRLKSEFVATVSHELRTPMTSIKGYVEILLMGAAGELSEQQTQFLEVVLSNAERLNILVSDLLDVSRIEAGKIDLSLQPLRLQELAREVIEAQRRYATDHEKPITFSLHIAEDLPKVLGDVERVRQIMANLVNNAYHYTLENGTVELRLEQRAGHVQIDVQDNGIGISPEEQKRVFERFYRGEDPLVLATAGTGLGLSIVRQLVEMHNGEIWVQSTGVPGEGSTFSVSLPVYDEEQR